jgi:hypothetical protein
MSPLCAGDRGQSVAPLLGAGADVTLARRVALGRGVAERFSALGPTPRATCSPSQPGRGGAPSTAPPPSPQRSAGPPRPVGHSARRRTRHWAPSCWKLALTSASVGCTAKQRMCAAVRSAVLKSRGARAVHPGRSRTSGLVGKAVLDFPMVDISRGLRHGARPEGTPCGPVASGPHFFLMRPS